MPPDCSPASRLALPLPTNAPALFRSSSCAQSRTSAGVRSNLEPLPVALGRPLSSRLCWSSTCTTMLHAHGAVQARRRRSDSPSATPGAGAVHQHSPTQGGVADDPQGSSCQLSALHIRVTTSLNSGDSLCSCKAIGARQCFWELAHREASYVEGWQTLAQRQRDRSPDHIHAIEVPGLH